jgi:hypothetical protein
MKHTTAFLCAAILCLVPRNSPAMHDDVLARPIVKCFHPAAKLVDVTYGRRIGGDGVAMVDVVASYSFADDVFHMPFVFELRETPSARVWRVVPDDVRDTGPGGASATCKMRNWQPLE